MKHFKSLKRQEPLRERERRDFLILSTLFQDMQISKEDAKK